MNIPHDHRVKPAVQIDALDTIQFLTEQLRRIETQAFRLHVEAESLRKVAEICYERDSK